MFRAEMLKVRSHVLPWVVYAILLLAAVVPAAVLAGPAGNSFTGVNFADVAVLVQANVGPLLVMIFGAWMGGAEFRWETWRIVLGRDCRRGLQLTNKLGVFLVVVGVVSLAVLIFGLAAMAAAAAVHGQSLELTGIGGAVTFVLLTQVVYGLVAFGIAVTSRSVAVAVAVTLVYYVLVDSLLGLLPDLRPYLLGPALAVVADRLFASLTGMNEAGVLGDMSIIRASIVIAAYVAVFLGAAYASFLRRDVAR